MKGRISTTLTPWQTTFEVFYAHHPQPQSAKACTPSLSHKVSLLIGAYLSVSSRSLELAIPKPPFTHTDVSGCFPKLLSGAIWASCRECFSNLGLVWSDRLAQALLGLRELRIWRTGQGLLDPTAWYLPISIVAWECWDVGCVQKPPVCRLQTLDVASSSLSKFTSRILRFDLDDLRYHG